MGRKKDDVYHVVRERAIALDQRKEAVEAIVSYHKQLSDAVRSNSVSQELLNEAPRLAMKLAIAEADVAEKSSQPGALTAEQLMLDHVRQVAEIRYQLREEIYQVLPLLPEDVAASLKDKCDRGIAPRPESWPTR